MRYVYLVPVHGIRVEYFPDGREECNSEVSRRNKNIFVDKVAVVSGEHRH